jgi:hypothetical protein
MKENLINAFQNLGICIYNSDGKLRSLYDVMSDLSRRWEELTEDEKDYIAESLATDIKEMEKEYE